MDAVSSRAGLQAVDSGGRSAKELTAVVIAKTGRELLCGGVPFLVGCGDGADGPIAAEHQAVWAEGFLGRFEVGGESLGGPAGWIVFGH